MSPYRKSLAALAGGAALGAANWPGDWGWLAWIALIPFWSLSRGATPGRAFLWGWLYGVAAWAAGLHWFYGTAMSFVPGVPAAAFLIWLALLASMGLMFGAASGGARLAAAALERGRGWRPETAFLAAAVPALTAAEGLFPQLFPATFAASQFWWAPLVQCADLAGGAAVTLLLSFWSAAWYLCWTGRGGTGLRAAAAAVALVAGSAAYGAWRLRAVDRASAGPDDRVRAAVIQGSIPEERRFAPEHYDENLAAHLALTREAAASGAEFIVWPQNSYERPLYFDSGDFSEPADAGGAPAAASLAADVPVEADVVLGAEVRRIVGRRAGRRVIRRHYAGVHKRADGGFGGISAKRFPTPFGEYIPGARLLPGLYRLTPSLVRIRGGPQRVLETSGGVPFGVFVCYDATQPAAARDLAAAGARILVELSSNARWFDERTMPVQTLRLSALRAVENRRPVLRAVSSGVSAWIDAGGRIRSSIPFGARGVLTADVSVRDDLPPAVELGLGRIAYPASFAAWLLLAAWGAAGRRQPPH